ncbi:MAG: aminotransferase class V-fold PLP-dependent enzyme [Spirochaetales bacterium]|uniref:Aminotransferase class V-fold PLP-dependent enzyme n=1 Tax=Candidatus Thalassospirochaeta sargassi TaxID=3119039 RepID=A0AAJ1IKS2_9SPIO|nr:aminotransferase class V-fold PLP-dependent enzyme [Spirochaetales bacterium]
MTCRCELRKKIKAAAVPWIPERTVYLDYNATTPVDPRVLGAFERACRQSWGNPSSLHSAGSAAWNELEQLYKAAGSFFNTEPEGFHFCSSGTEALTAAIFGLASRKKELCFITSPIEHQAVRHPLFHLGRRSPAAPAGYRGCVRTVGVNGSGVIEPDKLDGMLRDSGPAAVVISPVNHETGTVQPVREISRVVRGRGALLILDGVQAAARLQPAEWAPYADIFCISGHKLCAPKGTALIWKKPDIRLTPLRFGGSQEGGLFPGTENVPGAAALTEALRLLKKEQADELRMLRALIRDGIAILEKADIGFRMESPPEAAPGVLCISLDYAGSMEKLIFELNSRKICISRFSACSEKLDGPSPVLKAMGRPPGYSGKSIRISAGRWSRRDDFYKLAAALKECL